MCCAVHNIFFNAKLEFKGNRCIMIPNYFLFTIYFLKKLIS